MTPAKRKDSPAEIGFKDRQTDSHFRSQSAWIHQQQRQKSTSFGSYGSHSSSSLNTNTCCCPKRVSFAVLSSRSFFLASQDLLHLASHSFSGLRPLPCFFLLFLFPTMKFPNAHQLFSDGHAGQSLVTSLALPADLFPDELSWNRGPAQPKEALERLPVGFFATLVPGTSTGPLSSLSSSVKRTKFTSINAGSIRFSPTTRLWVADDVLAAQQRIEFGASLMVVRILRNDGTYSDPVLLVSGPSATPFNGNSWETRELLSLADNDPLPVVHGGVTFPASISPTDVF